MKSSQVKQTRTETIQNHPENPRVGDVEAIKQSITDNGFYGAIIVQKSTNYIVKGNHTYRAACQLGMEKIPVIFIDVDDDRAKKIMLSDNRTSDLGAYDDKALASLLGNLEDFDGSGYDEGFLTSLIGSLVSEEPETTPSNLGTLDSVERWQNSDKREVKLLMSMAEFGEVLDMWDVVYSDKPDFKSNYEVVRFLTEYYIANRPDKPAAIPEGE